MRVERSLWNNSVSLRPSLLREFRMYVNESDRRSANKLISIAVSYGLKGKTDRLYGKTLADWCSPSNDRSVPNWAATSASIYILSKGYREHADIASSALVHLIGHSYDISDFYKSFESVINHLPPVFIQKVINEATA